jgi:hypothetical protein
MKIAKLWLTAFCCISFVVIVTGSISKAFEGKSNVSSVPIWVKAGTRAKYLWVMNLKNETRKVFWEWRIESVNGDEVEVLHFFEGLSEDMPSVYKSIINVTSRGVINVIPVDKDLPPHIGFPLPTLFALWIPADIKINDLILVIGPFSSAYPPAPVLRFESVNTTLGVKNCTVVGFELESGCPETDLFWYDVETLVLVKYYMHWPMYSAEAMLMLMQWIPKLEFNLTIGKEIYRIAISSNSSIESFTFNHTLKTIKFNVKGQDGTIGFCNVTVPNSLIQNLWQGNFTVLVDWKPPISMDTLTDGNNTYIYFTYIHSSHEVLILPEFSSILTPLLSVLFTSIMAMLLKRRKGENKVPNVLHFRH